MSKDDTYTLKEMLTEMKVDMREHNNRAVRMEETLLAVLEQAKKTNGRVSALELNDERQDAEMARWKTVASTVGLLAGFVWAGVTLIFK